MVDGGSPGNFDGAFYGPADDPATDDRLKKLSANWGIWHV